jgi:hypothetical protein
VVLSLNVHLISGALGCSTGSRPYSPSGLVTFNVLSFEIWILCRVFPACFV